MRKELIEEEIAGGTHKEGVFELGLEEWQVFPDTEGTLSDLIKNVKV